MPERWFESGGTLGRGPIREDLGFPSVEDYRARLVRTRQAMAEGGFDVLALGGPDNHRFIGGVDGIATVRTVWLVIPVTGDPVFVAPRIEAPEIRAQSWIPVAQEWVEWAEDDLPLTAVDGLLRILPPNGVVGVDLDATSAATIDTLRARLGAARVADAVGLLREVRKVKDAVTADVVRCCADIAAAQFAASRAVAVPGVREWEIALASRDAAMRRAAEWWGGDEDHSPLLQGIHVMASGPDRLGRAHAVAAGRRLREGDLLQLCYCGRPFFGHGICYDRPVRVGDRELGPEVRRIVDVARQAQEAALCRVRPGVTSEQVADAAVSLIAGSGIPSAFRHRTGRGIGLSDPEWPEIKSGDTTVLEPGMLIAIEPGVYVDGVAGARFGDTVLVTDGGFEPLTDFHAGRSV